jgi:hypothetical protein
VVRIPSFLAREYPEVCAAAWREDDAGWERRAERRLVAELSAAVEALRAAGAAAIVLDVTGNGGGGDLARDLAAVVLGEPVRCPRVLLVRHPHWARQLEDELAETRAPARRAALARLLDEVRRPCDRAPLWRGEPIACTQLVPGLEDFPGCPPPEATLPPRPAAERTVLLVDGRTSSAAELFAAVLVDQGGARVAGAPTDGAGCGMTNGGVPITLPRTGLIVEVPDCVRLRRDGRNEREGITPDVSLSGVEWTPIVAEALLAAYRMAAK